MTYYVTVSFYDDVPDTEEYGSQEEAQEAYQTSVDMSHDGVLGDVARISYGVTKHNRNTNIASYTFD